MSYATTQDLLDWCGVSGPEELIELTDPLNAEINHALVMAKLNQADHEINARLVGVDLPMTAPYPPILVTTACKIARALLYRNRRPEHIEADYREAIEFLGQVRDGKASLGLSGDGTGSEPSPVRVAVDAPAIVFTDEVLSTL